MSKSNPVAAKIDEEKIKKFKLHRNLLREEGSRLTLVEEKELEIKGKVLEAKKEAEQILAEARREATRRKEKADQRGLAAAKKFYEREMQKVHHEAEKERQSRDKEINLIEEQGARHIEKAISFVLKKVLP